MGFKDRILIDLLQNKQPTSLLTHQHIDNIVYPLMNFDIYLMTYKAYLKYQRVVMRDSAMESRSNSVTRKIKKI